MRVYLFALLLTLLGVIGTSGESDYTYGDLNVEYGKVSDLAAMVADDNDFDYHSDANQSDLADSKGVQLDLCCPEGHIYKLFQCVPSSAYNQWKPLVETARTASYVYNEKRGMPRCGNKQSAAFHQVDVMIIGTNLILPSYTKMEKIQKGEYCVARIPPLGSNASAASVTTMVYTCLPRYDTPPAGSAQLVLTAFAHVLLALVLVAYCALPKLRTAQGIPIMFLVMSLLGYNICVYPLSALEISTNGAGCLTLRALKYLFFSSMIVWFNVLCFDTLRILKTGVSGPCLRRSLFYMLYATLMSMAVAGGMVGIQLANGIIDTSAKEVFCSMRLELYAGLILFEAFVLVANIVILGVASGKLKHAVKTADLSHQKYLSILLLGWKFLVIMAFHFGFDVVQDHVKNSAVPLWQYMVLESVAIFSLLIYKGMVLHQVEERLGLKTRGSTSNADDFNNLPDARTEKIMLSSGV